MCGLPKVSGADLYVLSVVEAEGHCERVLLANASKNFCLGVGEPYPNDLKLESHLLEAVHELDSIDRISEMGKIDGSAHIHCAV